MVPYLRLFELTERMERLEVPGKNQSHLWALGPHRLKIKEMHVFKMVLVVPLHILQLFSKVGYCKMVTMVKYR